MLFYRNWHESIPTIVQITIISTILRLANSRKREPRKVQLFSFPTRKVYVNNFVCRCEQEPWRNNIRWLPWNPHQSWWAEEGAAVERWCMMCLSLDTASPRNYNAVELENMAILCSTPFLNLLMYLGGRRRLYRVRQIQNTRTHLTSKIFKLFDL